MYRRALFRKYDIRECVVMIERMAQNQLHKEPKKTLRVAVETPRLNVSWLPTTSATHKNSSDALAALAQYRERHAIIDRIDRTNIIHQRTKSIFEKTCQSDNANKYTMEDFHQELAQKVTSPNRGLKPCKFGQFSKSEPNRLTEFEKIRIEFQAKLAAKRSTAAPQCSPPLPPPLPPHAKPKLSWEELKALYPKRYPVVECIAMPIPHRADSTTYGFSLAISQTVRNFVLYVFFLHHTCFVYIFIFLFFNQ